MPMKKFINAPADLVQELLEGFVLANQGKVALVGSNLVVRTHPKPKGKVALVTLGGSGHEPALSGFVGEGMLDISVPGEIFAAPGPPRVIEALRAANRDAGVLFVVLNHAGDVMSANIVMDMAKKEGLNVKQILTHEDVSGGPRDNPEERRGLVGALLVIKVAGAAAEQGKSLDECLAIAERMERNMATLAVAVSGATHPSTGAVIAEIPDDVMIVGMGQHGEAGGGTQKLKTADETADIMLPVLLEDLKIQPGEEVLLNPPRITEKKTEPANQLLDKSRGEPQQQERPMQGQPGQDRPMRDRSGMRDPNQPRRRPPGMPADFNQLDEETRNRIGQFREQTPADSNQPDDQTRERMRQFRGQMPQDFNQLDEETRNRIRQFKNRSREQGDGESPRQNP